MAENESVELSEAELKERGYHFETYGAPGGCIVAEYIGGGARYAGVSMSWRFQPLIDDWFESKAAAIRAVSRWLAGQCVVT